MSRYPRRVVVVNDALKWEGESVKVDILETCVKNSFTYLKVEIFPNGPRKDDSGKLGTYWVIRRLLSDLRPIIADRLKDYCKLNRLGVVRTIIKGRPYILTRSFDPNETPEVPLNVYIRNKKIEDIPIYVRRQVQKIYSFRMLMGMSNNKDSSLIIRTNRGMIKIYSLIDTFPPSTGARPKNSEFPESIFNRWFDSKDYNEVRNMTYHIADMIGVERDEKHRFTPDNFDASLDRFDKFLTNTIEKVDRNLIWLHGDIINLVIGKVTP